MTTISKALLALEEKFWAGDAEFYRRNLEESCLLALTKTTGVFNRDDVARTVKNGNHWKDLDIKLKGVMEPVAGVAIITYQAHATHETGEPYAAVVSSAYVKRDGGWRMTFHQQTPLATPGEN